jgi:hypothetical protein
MSEACSVVALGGATAAMFASEARARGLRAAWAPQQTVDDFRLVALRILSPDAMADLIRERASAGQGGLGRDELERNIRDALDAPSARTVVFMDEIPKPGEGELFYRRKMKKAIALLSGRAAMVAAPHCPALAREAGWLDETKRYWRPVLRTSVPLYGADGKPRAEGMAGIAKIVFMLVAAS